MMPALCFHERRIGACVWCERLRELDPKGLSHHYRKDERWRHRRV